MGKKSVEANSNDKQCENDTIVIERFSKKQYETYKAKGIPFHVVCGSSRLPRMCFGERGHTPRNITSHNEVRPRRTS